MSGHSKWSTIKHKKGRADAQRSRLWSKLVKEITVAARLGGGDPEGNPRLRSAVDAGRAANMPADNIDRAIKRGTGELEGVEYQEITYEGYGPEGVAILIEVLTDNKNRTVSEIRNIFLKNNAKMGESGSVAWLFDTRGVVIIPSEGVEEDDLMMAVMDAGAEDLVEESGSFLTYCALSAIEDVRAAALESGFQVEEAKIVRVPQTTVSLDAKGAGKMIRLYEALEDNDDVKAVWANFDIADELLEELSA